MSTPAGMDKATLRVLALDDDPLMLDMLSHVLRNLGFLDVTTCDEGRVALEHLDSARPPELILLDLNMPQMDGVEFARHLVARDYAGRLVLVSGEDPRVLNMVENLMRANRIAVVGQLKKPFTRASLEEMMDKATRRAAPPPVERRSYDAAALRAAIENGELVNFYQPKVSVASGALVGVETLVRWNHAQDGWIFPDQFIGVAEKHGLIDPLARTVLRGALAQSARWRAAGQSLTVAVNISVDNLASLDFADFVAQEAQQADVAPQDIVLEITESRLMLDRPTPLDVLARLRLKRFRLALDDFGTGHASLRQLHDIPFDELKIDRRFVNGASKNATARAIYDASVALGRQLGMTVVAEGVETRADWDLLRKSGCDMAQGYFIGRPMPADDLAEWMQEWRRRRP
jgi:EAL domain-containing protein (putative c-di-GMP-specific phosphodiesterase class I)/AmiR/NasT family two-component response regulator